SLDAQKKTGAVEAYRKYLAVVPTDRAARSRLIQILTEQQQFDAALEESKKDPAGQAGAQAGAIDALKQRADIEIGQKKYDEAIGTLQQALKLTPQDATLHGAVGRLYMQKRDFAAAERELKAALQLDRGNLVYWKDLSSTYYLAGNCPAALESLELIARVETPGAGTWFIRALCYDKLVQVKPALDAYRKFLELDENRNPDQVWQANQRIHVLEKMAGKKK
ncbi:MAG TPA: tetratricopeptide repeat protein, partial [Candidatus Acidoferrum sp.]